MKILKKFQIACLVSKYLLNLAATKVVQVKLYIISSQMPLATSAAGTTIFTTGTTR
jgi:hypothetical protein